jgi:hypothetical protein
VVQALVNQDSVLPVDRSVNQSLNWSVPLRWGNHIWSIGTGLDRLSTFGAFVVKVVGVDVDDPVPINTTLVVTNRTVERCLVRRLTLGVVIRRNHFCIYYLHGNNGVVLCPRPQLATYLLKRRLWGITWPQYSARIAPCM